jgi:hypothetical protein
MLLGKLVRVTTPTLDIEGKRRLMPHRNIIGPFLFLPQEAPRYITAVKSIAGIYGATIFLSAVLGIIMLLENRRRSKLTLTTEAVNEQGFSDFTDLENKGFHYKL